MDNPQMEPHGQSPWSSAQADKTEALYRITPGIYSRHTLLYGVEVKFYTNRLKLSPTLETDIQNLFLVGDGAGITRGLIQASMSGMIAADEILKRMGLAS